VPAVEVLLQSPYISQLIQDGEIHKIKEVMEDSNEMGMRTFDQALFELYQLKRISHDEALRNADSKNNLALKMRLVKTAKAIAQPA
jgi:twitching motility protein PilU